MHSACLLLLVSYCTLTLGLFAPPTRTPGRGLGLLVARTDGSISAVSTASSASCLVAAVCSRSRTAGTCGDSEELARLTFLQAVRRGSPAGPLLGRTRRSPSWLLSAGPALRRRRRASAASHRAHSLHAAGARPGTSRRRRHGGLALPPRPDGPRARHARGHVAPGPHHR